MELIKTIILNNNTVNEFTVQEEQAKAELIKLLIDKVKKHYKIKMHFDNISRTIKATLTYNHILYDGRINTYTYIYTFKNIPNTITLY